MKLRVQSVWSLCGVGVAVLLGPVSLGCGPDAGEAPLQSQPRVVDLTSFVNPFVGTGGLGFGVGATYPGPALPFAMTHPGPDTRPEGATPGLEFYHCSGYYWDDPLIAGFSLTRANGTGVPDYGTIAFMPVSGMHDGRRSEPGYASRFQHENEEAEAGYYRVRMDDGIQVEITSTLRAALFRYEFPEGSDPVVLVDLEHVLSGSSGGGRAALDPASGRMNVMMHMNGALSGRFGGFDVFAQAFPDVVPMEVGVWDDTGLRDGETRAEGQDVGAWLRFSPDTRSVQIRVGMSFVDPAGAARNLAAEIPTFAFDAVREEAREAWRSVLSRFEVWGASDHDATMLASAAYHVHLMPGLMSDVDGRAVAVDGSIVQSTESRFSDFSLWDTYRTLHPWLLLMQESHNRAFALSLTSMAQEGGAVPKWTMAHGDTHSMTGSPGEIVLAESALKGVELDEATAYELSRVAAFGPAPGPTGGRGGIEDYLVHGYVPADLHAESVAKTLEFAVADAALANWARRLGRTDDLPTLDRHANAWRNVYDQETGFFRGRLSDGTWDQWHGPIAAADVYEEGNAWQYLWMVPHDPDGLAEQLGGREVALSRLREFFESSATEKPLLGLHQYYWHGNEPDINAAWLFAAWGAPSETAAWVDWIIEESYGTGPDGLAGNDDGGTLSAWLLFAAAGLYPLSGTDRYVVGAPRYPRLVLHRDGGDLRIEASPDPRTHRVPLRVTLDAEPLTGTTLSHEQLVGDHVLSFTMGG